jgi:signal transduction histidine kinase
MTTSDRTTPPEKSLPPPPGVSGNGSTHLPELAQPPQPAMPELQTNILLVDDRPDKLLALEASLAPLGQNIIKARSGREALRLLLQQDFAVLLLDVSMPDMDGFETAALIRQRPRTEHTPIIFVTSIGNTRDHISQGYSLGAVDYLLTPIMPDVLRSKVSVFVALHRQTELIRRQGFQLGDLNRQLEQRVSSLTSANLELEAFNYSIAHDLRAPLRSMGGFAKALLEDEAANLSPVARDYAARVVRSADYMDRMLLDLLAYSRLARSEVPPQRIDLDELVTETLAAVEREIRDRAVKVELTSPLGVVHAHPPTVRQILSNLIGNSLKFITTSRPPVLRVTTTLGPGFIRLWVEDNGIGIPPQFHEKIFGLFQRLHTTDAYPGTGIGLALVRKGAERMGGRAGVESKPGEGSRFWVDLPVLKASNNGA